MYEQNNQSRLKTNKGTIKESIMSACTNLFYKIGGIGGIKKVFKTAPTGTCVILGQRIADPTLAKQRLNQIIWFTYRDKLKIAEDIYSDVGWGCLPRAAQMVLAQALTRHFNLKHQHNSDQQYLAKIIEPFIDGDQKNSVYSLSTILKYGRKGYNINPGDWFNVGKISDVIRKIQEEIPMKGSQNMKIAFFSQSVIFMKELEEKGKVKKCLCMRKNNWFCIKCNQNRSNSRFLESKVEEEEQDNNQMVLTIQQYNEINRIQSLPDETEQQISSISRWEVYGKQNKNFSKLLQNLSVSTEFQEKKFSTFHKMQNSLLVIISVRLSQKTIESFDLDSIFRLLGLSTSIGAIGGVPNKAIYIVGYERNDFIYLDPHYVQQYVDKFSYSDNLHTFFCKQYRCVNFEELDPSMAFCFYLRSIQDTKELIGTIEQLKRQYDKKEKSFFISLMDSSQIISIEKLKESESPESDKIESFEYSSLQFRDISDSL